MFLTPFWAEVPFRAGNHNLHLALSLSKLEALLSLATSFNLPGHFFHLVQPGHVHRVELAALRDSKGHNSAGSVSAEHIRSADNPFFTVLAFGDFRPLTGMTK